MPHLSIIIACHGDTAEFEDALAAVLQNRPDDCEVLVALPQKYDDPYGLSGEVRFVEVCDACGLPALMNAAASAASGEVLHFIDCSLTVHDGWTVAATRHFDDPDVAAVSPLVVDQKRERIISAGVVYGAGGVRRVAARGKRYSPDSMAPPATDGPVLQAAFYRAEVFHSLGGFAEEVGSLLADVDLAMSIAAARYRCQAEPACVLRSTSAAASADARPATTFSAGRCAERLFWRSAASRGSFTAALLHLAAIAGDFVAALPHPGVLLALAGRAVACFEGSAYRRHRDSIRSFTRDAALMHASEAPGKPGLRSKAASAAKRVA